MSYPTVCANPTPQCPTACRFAKPVTLHPLVYVVRGRPGPLDRPALPSGHPDTWGAITHGTVLDQSIYPFPIFLDLPQ